jgi:predicted methyltransferase
MLHHRPAKLPLVMGKVRSALKVGGLVTIPGLLPTSKGEDLDVASVMEVMCRTCSGTSLGLMKFLLIRFSRLLHMGLTR